jgi:hypothetical protein
MLVGLGSLSSVVAIVAVISRIPLSWLMASLAALIALIFVRQRRWPGGRSTWIALVLVSPIVVVASGQQPALWDDFWNWLPSAAYLYWKNSLPWLNLEPSLAIFPGYPQAMQLTIASASFIGGRFLEQSGPVVNALLLAGGSAVLAEALAAALARRGRLRPGEMPVAMVAFAVAVTTVFNPGLNGSVLLSSYADSATMIAVGALGLLGVEILARLSAPGSANVNELAWRFGLVGALLINLKQANPALLALIVLGLMLIAVRDPAIPRRAAAAVLPRMLAPACLLMAVWRWYVAQSAPQSEQSFRRFSDWNFDVLGQTFASIGGLIIEAPLFHTMMWIATAIGAVCFFQLPYKTSEARRLAVVCATVWPGYNAVLLTIYLGNMSNHDAQIAADYWRYTPHATLLGLYAPVMWLAADLWPASWKPRSVLAPIAMGAIALCALPVRSDLRDPPGRLWQSFLRTAVAEMREMLPLNSKVLIVPYWSSSPFGVAVRYNLWGLQEHGHRRILSTIVWDLSDFADLINQVARNDAGYLLIQDIEGSMNEVTDKVGLPRLSRELALFEWKDGDWRRLRSWPAPPALSDKP